MYGALIVGPLHIPHSASGRRELRTIHIGADFYGEMLATAPGKFFHMAPPCEKLDPPYVIKLNCFCAENYISS